jgi:hypothetical protein
MQRRSYASLAFWALARRLASEAEGATPNAFATESIDLDVEEPVQGLAERTITSAADTPSARQAA